MYPIAWKLLLSFAFLSCATWYAKAHFYRDPGSAFFDPARAYEQQYSLTRKAEIQQFIESQSSTIIPNQHAESKGATLCVGISSVKRTKEQYLEVRHALLYISAPFQVISYKGTDHPENNSKPPHRPHIPRTSRPPPLNPNRRTRRHHPPSLEHTVAAPSPRRPLHLQHNRRTNRPPILPQRSRPLLRKGRIRLHTRTKPLLRFRDPIHRHVRRRHPPRRRLAGSHITRAKGSRVQNSRGCE